MITIGIPCYNQVEYVSEAIETALEQSEGSEVIVVDDGSTDGSDEVIRKYPVKMIRQVNKGLASARNTIIMNMKGHYLLPLDADDMLLPNCVEKIQAKIDETNADIIVPSFKCFGVENHEVILDKPVTESFKESNRIGYFSAVRKDKLLEIGGYSPRMTWGYEDYHLWIDLLKRGATIEVIQEPLVLYRTRQNSMISTARLHHEELMNQIKKDHSEIYED